MINNSVHRTSFRLSRQKGTEAISAVACFIFATALMSHCGAEDWPMWRQNSGRSGATAEGLPEKLSLKWVRHLPAIKPAFHSSRLQFDAGYEPIVADGRLLVASSLNDSVTAYESSTGKELWVFRTNGPVRCAPAVWKQSVCFGSDDGYLYCIELETGKLLWKHQAVPNDRRLLGNRRLISVWPVRGGVVVAEGIAYFAAGVWPFEGVFVYAMEVSTGTVIWRNERLGHMYGQQPHNTQAIGGLAPQGYLIVNDAELIVPCSTAYPARLDRKTGDLIQFELPSPGRFPGGWFATLDPQTSKDIRRGKLTFDDLVNQQQHEDKLHKGFGESGISRTIHAGQRVLKFDDKLNEVDGTIHSMIVADQQLIVSTREGKIFCLGASADALPRPPTDWPNEIADLQASDTAASYAKALVREAPSLFGTAIVMGLTDGELVKALVKESRYHVVAFDDDANRVERLRRELQRAGVYGERAAVIHSDLKHVSIPPFVANVVVTESASGMHGTPSELLQSLRPFGGIAMLGEGVADEQMLQSLSPGKFELSKMEGRELIRRIGALPGTADYVGNYEHCEDTLVRFPLGVLWFDDTLAHFKRSPQPEFRDGIMVSRPKDWHAERIKGEYKVDYPLLRSVFSDIYTGRVLDASEQSTLRKQFPDFGLSERQQSYYHAPHQTTALNPLPPIAGERINPLTGKKEPRVFPKNYGCDGGVDYGLLYTLRSGTAAYYDKTLESGTVFISGPRSGCTNSIIPSGGLLNVPYFYEGCTCSYPLPTALSLVAMPETHEQWSSWGDGPIEISSIERIGVNFGAPGDRKTRDGTLWLDYPSVGGPSPKIRIETIPENPTYHYRHSNWMKGGAGWPWVAASCVEGLEMLKLLDMKPGKYTVRLYFAENAQLQPGARVQNIYINGDVVLSDFDILAEAKKSMSGIVRQIEGVMIKETFSLRLQSIVGKSLISGFELIRVE
ncbi:MAG: PQQ-binding-like beta-propeller repeat protein [Pirellula sp.]